MQYGGEVLQAKALLAGNDDALSAIPLLGDVAEVHYFANPVFSR